jgi:hypothetical protein
MTQLLRFWDRLTKFNIAMIAASLQGKPAINLEQAEQSKNQKINSAGTASKVN